MSPVFLPLAENLTYLVLAFLPQNVPDDFISDDYAGLTTLRTSFTNALRQLKHLEALEIPFWESREDPTFKFSTDIMPSLKHISIGDWQQWDAFEVEHKIDVVKWLIHPDLDFDEGIIRGFFEHLGRQTRVLQFAAQSGWGRTDLPQGLTENVRQISWYKVRRLSRLSLELPKSVRSHPFAPARRTSTSTRSRASPSTASTRSRRTSASGSSSSPRSSRFSARPTSAASPSSTSPRCATRAGTASTGARPSR